MKKNFWRFAQVILTISFTYLTIIKIDLDALISLLQNVDFTYIIISVVLLRLFDQ